MPEDTKFEDESFDLSEIEGTSGQPIFLHDGIAVGAAHPFALSAQSAAC